MASGEGIKLFPDLREIWPQVFDEENQEQVEELLNRAYHVEINSDTDDVKLILGFAYDSGEAYTAFKDGADIVGNFAPDTADISCTTTGDGGCIVYITMQWEDEEVED